MKRAFPIIALAFAFSADGGESTNAQPPKGAPGWEAILFHLEGGKTNRVPFSGDSIRERDQSTQSGPDAIASESFEQTLDNTASFPANYMSGPSENLSPAEGGSLRKIVASRRYAKLIAEYHTDAVQHRGAIMQRLREDIKRFEVLKQQDPNKGKAPGFISQISSEDLPDQSILPFALSYRINAAQLLIGQLSIHEALPLLLESAEMRDGTWVQNWTSVAYACDKLLTAPLQTNAFSAEQLLIRDQYEGWKKAILAENSDRYSRIQQFFRYEKGSLPGDLEFPPAMISEGSYGAAFAPSGPQLKIVEFAKEFVAAGVKETKTP